MTLELLAPAGDIEKLKTVVDYGADAVYFGGQMFSLRAGAGNLSVDEIREAMDYLHERGRKGYMTLNIYAHNYDIEPLSDYLKKIKDIPIDAFLVSDPGVMMLLRENIPDAVIHLSTQANTTNYLTAEFWAEHGASRIVAAREMSLVELKEMREKLPENVEIEAFVHGAMCMSYSGRCLLSNYMTGRDANRGMCAHPCRWKYSLVEERRPGEYYPVEEDERGSYILNSRDLCMLDSIPDLAEAGVTSFKIEGRNKSAYYAASVVSAYRAALDAYIEDPEHYVFKQEWMDELVKASHREFSHGFYYGKPGPEDHDYETSDYVRDYDFVGVVRGFDEESGLHIVEQRNKFSEGDTLEIFGPRSSFTRHFGKDKMYLSEKAEEMYDEEGTPIESAPHAQQTVLIRFENRYEPGYMIRRKKPESLQ